MKKQIILTLEKSEILPSNGQAQVGFNLMIGDTCEAADVQIMANAFINWYLQNGQPPQPPPRAEKPNRIEDKI